MDTVGKLKVGTPLIFGRYGVRNDDPYDIVWLKATPDSDFITRDVVDFLPFDANEPNSVDYQHTGNDNYRLSNLLCFLNSEQAEWYYPTHHTDGPPTRARCSMPYDIHYGFLYHFEEYELASLDQCTQLVNDEPVSSLIRLPSLSEVSGNGRFPLFRKKGVRPHPTDDMAWNRNGHGISSDQYCSFYLSDKYRRLGYASVFSRSGGLDGGMARYANGVRPVCTINPNTEVVPGNDGTYRIKSRIIEQKVFTDAELFSLLGIAQP